MVCSFALAAAARACRPVCRPQFLASAPTRRALHVSSTTYAKKSKKAAAAEEMFDEDFYSDEHGTTQADAADNGHVKTMETTQAQAARQAKSTTFRPRQRTSDASFDTIFAFMEKYLTTKPSKENPTQVRQSVWLHLINAAESEEDLRRAASKMAEWKASGRGIRDTYILEFVLRCHKLNCLNVVLDVFSNRPNFRIDIPNIQTGRELLHGISTQENAFEMAVLVSSLYALYNLPPFTQDYVSCAIMLSICMRSEQEVARDLERSFLPTLRELLKTAPTTLLRHREPEVLRDVTLLRASLSVIEETLRERGEDVTWLLKWRAETMTDAKGPIKVKAAA